MLMCGEDLGFTPACVRPIMEELGILGETGLSLQPGQWECVWCGMGIKEWAVRLGPLENEVESWGWDWAESLL